MDKQIMMGLKEECGVTDYSLRNAQLLIEKQGIPDRVRLTYVERPWDFLCEAEWYDKPISKFVFSGFSWGYFGEGPRGLATFLNTISGKDISELIKMTGTLETIQLNFVVFEREAESNAE